MPHRPTRPIRPTPPAVPGHPLASNEMLEDWLGDSGKLDAHRLQHLIDFASEDPESKKLVAEAMREFGAENTELFLPLFEVSSPSAADGSSIRVVAGEFDAGSWDMQSRSVEPSEYFAAQATGQDLLDQEPYKSWIEGQLTKKHAYIHFVDLRSSLLRLTTYSGPKVRLPSKTSVADAYETFMHELAHFVRFSPQAEPDPTQFGDAHSYDLALLAMPGQEVDARVFGIRSLTRLVGDVPYSISLPVEPTRWFSPQGVLLRSQAELVDLLQGFMGYHFPGVYENRLELLKQADFEEAAGLRQALLLPPPSSGQLESDWRTRASDRLVMIGVQVKRITELQKAQIND